MSSITFASEDATPEENNENLGYGGYFTNSHHANRHEGPDGRETGGEDTVYIGVGVFWKNNFDSLIDQLESSKKAAQEYHDPIQSLVAGQILTVYPSGVSSGGGRGNFYRYLIKKNGITFKISHHAKPIEQTPNVMIEVGSEVCMVCRGLSNVWAEIKNILEELGGYIIWNKLSRGDFCIDIPGVDVGLFVDLVLLNRQYICRARDETFHRESGTFTGFSIGKGTLQMRVYNKAYEVKVKKPNPAKLKLLEKFRWEGPQEKAVRVEFQLMRDVIKQLGLTDIENYYKNRAAAIKYLTEDWFRLTSIIPDRENNNTHRAPTHELWKGVQNDFQLWAGKCEKSAIRDYRSTLRDPIRLLKQSGGCLMSAIADLTQERDLDGHQLRQYSHKTIDWYFDDMNQEQTIRKYRKSSVKRIATTPGVKVVPNIDKNVVPWVSSIDDAVVPKRAGMPVRIIRHNDAVKERVRDLSKKEDSENDKAKE